MVVAVIAILTLIALPMFRKRIEEARINGCKDEMKAIATAEELAFAETGFYYRLNDLDNTTDFRDTDFNTGAIPGPNTVPVACWNRELTLGLHQERWQLCRSDKKWNGPYMAFKKFAYLDQMVDPLKGFDQNMFRYQTKIQGNPSGGGAILILDDNYDIPTNAYADRYPLDPWGNPYIFFGIGALDPNSADSQGTGVAHYYFNCAIFSMGPNGQPGDGQGTIDAQSYWRYSIGAYPVGRTSCLGLGDDLMYEF